uniref:PE-PPE domain-containing protein n=1 Tax=Mycolicibacterium psychrotolerans TaxID=216929 RepID=UPI0021F3A0AB|nr:PE-PPE domain-containing protein [Mycolicibacterium psychrotolerans]
MNAVVRSLSALVLVTGVAVLAVSSTLVSAAVTLTATTTALVMGGSFHPLMEPRDSPAFVAAYLDNAVDQHLDPAFAAAGPVTNAVAVYGPEDFFPIGRLTFDKSVAAGRANLDRCIAAAPDCVFNPDVGSVAPRVDDTFLVFGYSQSAVIASLTKRDLIEAYRPGDPSLSFMLVANPMRPNGGILMRFAGWPTIPILGVSFDGASPTDSADLGDGQYAYPTVDIVRQYDALGGDFPLRPLNLLATLNALVGYGLQHGETVDVPFGDATYQGREGDTTYYMITADIVPLLEPLAPFIPAPILRAVDAPLRVLIENAYDRDIGPGTPTRARWWPVHHVARLARDLLRSVPVAVDNLVEGFGGRRILGTNAPGPFGVGKPDLPPASEVASESVDTETTPQREHVAQKRLSRQEETDKVMRTEMPDDVESASPEPDLEREDTTNATEPQKANDTDHSDPAPAADTADPAPAADTADPAPAADTADAA